MIQAFTRFTVEIKNLKFITEEGRRLPKTAIIQFHFEGMEKPVVEILGYMEPEDIYKLIDENAPVNLDFCYINKLSINDYRHSRRLEKKTVVKLKSFSAKHAFFDANFPIDLSYIYINSGGFSLEKSIFARGTFTMNYSQFENVDLDLSYILFMTNQFDFSNVSISAGSISFKNSIFKEGKKDFQYTNFGNGEKIFTNVEFNNGDVSFINTQFNDGNVSFKIARFGTGKVDFHYAKFGEGDKTFERAEFGNGGVDFRTVEFGSGRINFNRSSFGKGETSFEACQLENSKFSFKRAHFLEGSLSFELAEMEGTELSFERTNFGKGSISFYNSKIGNLSLNSCHLDNYTDLRVAKCGLIDLSNTIVRDIIDLKPYEFKEDIDSIHLGGMRLIGRIYIGWTDNDVLRLIKSQKCTDNRLKAEQFRSLKENFNVCGQYNDEDKSYLEFKRHEAKADLQEHLRRNKWNIIWAGPLQVFKWIVFDRVGHYATNPVRVISSMMVSYIFFSFLFFFLILLKVGDITESVAHPGNITILGKAFYHSAITFLTIGYGDYYPVGAIRWLSGLEGFTGVFLMSYFTVAFVRKILR